MNKADFKGTLGDRSVNLYTLTNSNGCKVSVTNYGARLVELKVPDREGNFDNIVVGPGSMEAFLDDRENYFGAVIGRYANRIASGKITVDGQEYSLRANEGAHHLHGGPAGFHRVVWGGNQVNPRTLHLSYRSVDGEGGYPGNLGVKVTYRLTDQNELHLSYRAESDERTILNMSHHAYYNLHGANNGGSVDSHRLEIRSEQFTPVDADLIPTGEIADVEGSPLDFRSPKPIGKDRESGHSYLEHTDGYDHNFVLSKEGKGKRVGEGENQLYLAAGVQEPESGRSLKLYTTEPGLQFYVSQNPMPGIDSTFCLEPQHFPDSPHHPNFPSTVLEAYQAYHWQMMLSFDQ
ncbi:aldose 1-epimerase [Fodinibius roseus]|uniref:Aldose 1-epimerase n=1 Tax=Fodinibius roseus TaxID=1194090 RepID=A0A1M5K2L3_9BACT|nr:aldose epimerase family protein [Fodinibius roseus]SHG46984.1 aldose 1-epimerase [Fodinibius roseus]